MPGNARFSYEKVGDGLLFIGQPILVSTAPVSVEATPKNEAHLIQGWNGKKKFDFSQSFQRGKQIDLFLCYFGKESARTEITSLPHTFLYVCAEVLKELQYILCLGLLQFIIKSHVFLLLIPYA